MKNAVSLRQIPLRERKLAHTRISLLHAVIELVREKPLSDIPIEIICERADLSKPTFFRHFSCKTDLLNYFMQLWHIGFTWHTTLSPDYKPGLNAIEEYFDAITRLRREHPRMVVEYIILAATKPLEMPDAWRDITPAERMLHFPDLEGIERIAAQKITVFFPANLEAAVEAGELPSGADIYQATLNLESILYGLPIRLAIRNAIDTMADTFRAQLDLLWEALGASERTRDRLKHKA